MYRADFLLAPCLNGQKKYPNGTKIVRWFHYFCPLVQFLFLVQAGTFFAAFLGGPSKGLAKNRLDTQCMKSSKRRLEQILPTYPPQIDLTDKNSGPTDIFLSVWATFLSVSPLFPPQKNTTSPKIWQIYLPTSGALCIQRIFC